MKTKQVAYLRFRYFESVNLVWPLVIKTLSNIGWLPQKIKLSQGQVIKIRESKSKMSHAKIMTYVEKQILELVIRKNNIGEQIISFNFIQKSHYTLLEVATKVIFKANVFDQKQSKKMTKNILNTFKSNVKHFDSLVRDQMEQANLKAYF